MTESAVLKYLTGLPDGEVVRLRTDHENYTVSVASIKSIIDKGLDNANGFFVEFSTDFMRVRKNIIVKSGVWSAYFKEQDNLKKLLLKRP